MASAFVSSGNEWCQHISVIGKCAEIRVRHNTIKGIDDSALLERLSRIERESGVRYTLIYDQHGEGLRRRTQHRHALEEKFGWHSG